MNSNIKRVIWCSLISRLVGNRILFLYVCPQLYVPLPSNVPQQSYLCNSLKKEPDAILLVFRAKIFFRNSVFEPIWHHKVSSFANVTETKIIESN